MIFKLTNQQVNIKKFLFISYFLKIIINSNKYYNLNYFLYSIIIIFRIYKKIK